MTRFVQHQAEDMLDPSRVQAGAEAGWQELFESAPAATIVFRGGNHIVEFVNATHKRLFASADWVGSPFREASGSDGNRALLRGLDEAIRLGAPFEIGGVETTPEDLPGSAKRILRFVCGPVPGENEGVSRLICQGFDVTERHRSETRRAALALLGEKMRELDDADDLAFAAAEILGRTLGVGRAGYGTIDLEREIVHIERDWTAPGVASLAGTLHFRDYGNYIDDLKLGNTVVFSDARTDPRTAATADALCAIQARSVVNMPVTEQGGFVALLYLNAASPRVWSQDELALIREVADLTRAAVARRRAEAAVRRNEARLGFLDALGKETAASTEADEIMFATTRTLGRYLGVAVCAYADMDDDQNGFTIRGDWSAPGSPSIVGHYELADFGHLAVTNLGAGKPLVLRDIRAELDPDEAATFLDIGLAATICMPLVKQGRLTALMAVHDAKPRHWTDADLALLTEVTERSWAHIERVRSDASVREGERRFREELETKVAERTQALQQVQKMEAIGNLTGGIAHDFNNLLMAISGSLELLRKRLPPNPSSLRLLDNAMEGIRRGSSLTQRMLAFARRQELKTERVDVPTLVHGMSDLLQRSLGPMIAVEVRMPDRLRPIEVDPNQLEAALLNLAVNARDAMPGGGRIVISAREEPSVPTSRGDDRLCVHLSVTDEGEGMDEATLARATEPFFTTKGVGKGTGLGLSMVYGFVDQSGGTLSLRSLPGKGTTAEISLPAKPFLPDAVSSLPERSMPVIPVTPRGYSILAVDDDALILMNTGDLLEDLGHEVVLASSAREALEKLAERDFDLIVTDHAMPRMTGAQLIVEVRSRKPDMPIILATGYAELPADAGIADVPRLSKPFSQLQLEKAVANAMIGPNSAERC